MEICYTDVYDALSLAIKEQFPDKAIFGGYIGQGMTKGAFNIVPLRLTSQEALGKRQKRTILFDIVYYEDANEHGIINCLKIADVVPMAVKHVKTPKGCTLNSFVHNFEVKEAVMQMSLSFTFFVMPYENPDYMEILDAEFMEKFKLHIGCE